MTAWWSVLAAILGVAIGLAAAWCWFFWLITRGLWGKHWFRRHRRDMEPACDHTEEEASDG